MMTSTRTMSAARPLVALLAALVVTFMMMLSAASMVRAEQPVDLHCDDHNAVGVFKYEREGNPATGQATIGSTTVYFAFTNDGKTISFYSDSERTQPLVVEFCVKGGNELSNTGKLTGSTYTHPQQISYIVIYEVPTPTPSPTEFVPTPTPADTPTPSPTEFVPTPTPADTPTPTPADTPTPSPTEFVPTPAPTGTPAATPTPAPTGTPPDTAVAPSTGGTGGAIQGNLFVLLLVGSLAAMWLVVRPMRQVRQRR
jgi:hypothetical protein